jgi:DNA-binding NarL/FixJ family response regulator
VSWLAQNGTSHLSQVTVVSPLPQDKNDSLRGAMGKVRVLLADDHEPVLARIRTVLGEEFEIVGAVSNGEDAILEVWRLDPDVLVIDISMPLLDGLQAVSRLHSSRTKVVFLTVHEDPDFVAAAFAVGASGYVVKSDVTTDLIPAIHEVMDGGTYISQSIPS